MAKGAIAAIKPDEEWQVEQDMRTMIECKKIESDPRRLAKVRALTKKRLEEAAGVLDETKEAE